MDSYIEMDSFDSPGGNDNNKGADLRHVASNAIHSGVGF
jgi:hypothetical protein